MVDKRKYKIAWWDFTVGIVCECGEELSLSDEGLKVCECGLRYALSSSLSTQEPRGRCQAPGCGNWVHSSQSKAIYCSTACTEKGGYAKARAKLLAKRAADGG